MADEDLRRIERLARSGDPDAIERLRRARQRTGTYLPAVHFVPEDYHVYVDIKGEFTIDPKRDYDDRGRIHYVMSPCGVTLWPRGQPTQRKVCRFTKDRIDVTCKTCLRTMAAPKIKQVLRRHYAPGSFGGRPATPVCDKSDPIKYKEVFLHTMKGVTCPTCIRVMQMGRRLPRSPRPQKSVADAILDDMAKVIGKLG